MRQWLRTAAGVPGFIGFAVGRTTFWDPLVDYRAGRITRDAAVAQIAASYREWVDSSSGRSDRPWGRSREGPARRDRPEGRLPGAGAAWPTYNLTLTDGAHRFSLVDYLMVLRAYGTTVTGTVTARDAVDIFGGNLA